jgi:adenosine deaminase
MCNTNRKATKGVIEEFDRDGVVYLELRSTPRKNELMKVKEYIEAILAGIEDCTDVDIIVRLIISVNRSMEPGFAKDIVESAAMYRPMVVGIDLCGDPSSGSWDALKPVFQYARSQFGFKITLHCAEIDESSDEEIASMLAFNPERLGHGTFLDHATLNREIPIEICLSSNLITRTVVKIEDHHVEKLRMSDHPYVICTDDSGVFNCTNSGELRLAANAFNLSQRDIFDLCRRSVNYIFADGVRTCLFSVFDQFKFRKSTQSSYSTPTPLSTMSKLLCSQDNFCKVDPY